MEVASLPKRRAILASPEAYDYYLRGLHELDEFASDSIDAARGYFQKALALDPTFAPAAVGIAETDEFMCVDAIQPSVTCPRGHASVDAALKLDPNSADAYAMQAEIFTVYDWDWDAAAAAITKATDLGGGTLSKYAEARLAYAIGDMGRARQALQQIMSNNPFSPDAMFDMGFFVEFRSRNFDIAESWMRRALEIAPRYLGGVGLLGLAQLAQGKLDEALASMKQETIDDGRLPGLAVVYWAMNRKADSDTAISAMERNDAYPPSAFAGVYAFRNERERALKYLEKAYQTHDPELWYIKGDPTFRNLESDSRFIAFLRKMNLQE